MEKSVKTDANGSTGSLCRWIDSIVELTFTRGGTDDRAVTEVYRIERDGTPRPQHSSVSELPLDFSKRPSPIGDCSQRQIAKPLAHKAATLRLVCRVLGPGSCDEHVPPADDVEFDDDHIHVDVRG